MHATRGVPNVGVLNVLVASEMSGLAPIFLTPHRRC